MTFRLKIELYLFFIFLLLGVGYSATAQKKVKLTGRLINFNNEVEVRDNSEVSDLMLNPSDRMILPDSLGNFIIEFYIKKSNYFIVGANLIYLSPGDNSTIEIDILNSKNSQFKGSHALENSYLKTVNSPKMASFLEGGTNIKKTIEETIDTIQLLKNQRLNKLQNINGIDEQFKKLEVARLKADYINSLQNIFRYYIYINRIPKDSVKMVMKKAEVLIKPLIDSLSYNFLDKDYLKLDSYRKNIDLIKNNSVMKSSSIDDYQSARDIYYKIYKIKDKSKILFYKDSILALKDVLYKTELLKSYNALMSFGTGDKAINFIAKNEIGENVSLQSFNGKIIVLDFWATWCSPCMDELLFLEKLKETYKQEEIVFISISIDEDQKKWLNDLTKRKATGLQWNISRNKIKEYAINGIPRTIIIDKDFIISQMNAPLPSSSKMNSLINLLLAK